MREFDYDELCKATKNFSISQIIGKGSHGCIYKGYLQNNQIVAIKRCSIGLQILHDNYSKLQNEAKILSSLPNTHNNNIVTLLGTSTQENSVRSIQQTVITNTSSSTSSVQMLVMEYMPNGTLHDFLHTNNFLSPSILLLTFEKRAQIALQIAKAVQLLHTLKPKVIHRDIKSTNILLDINFSPKLIDFGLAVTGLDDSVTPAGTIGYLDPCYTTPCKLSTKNDVFSFGVVLLEIITGQKAIDTLRSRISLIEWVLPLIKDGKFSWIFDTRIVLSRVMKRVIMQFLGIAIRCVSYNVDDRPTCDEIVCQMENSYFYVGRIRSYPFWIGFLRGIMILKKKERSNNVVMLKKRGSNNTATVKIVVQRRNEVSKKLLLRDFLVDDIRE